MNARDAIASDLTELGIIAVVRTSRAEDVLPVCDALVAGGVLALEITLTVPNALAVLRDVKARFDSLAVIGAGTVLDEAGCLAALQAGAQFIVSPIAKVEILKAAHASERPVMLGAYTPTEAQAVHEAGADFIKIFPADKLGPGYIKSIRAPLPHLRIVPTGGVDLQTAPEFVKAGCAALGVGSTLISPDIVRQRNWGKLTQLAGEFMKVVREARSFLAQTRANSS